MNRQTTIMLILQLLLTIVTVLIVLHWQYIDIRVQCGQSFRPANIFGTT